MSFSWQKYSLISSEIESVKNIIIEEINGFPRYIKTPLLELVFSNAKYLRSGFFILCSKFGEAPDPERILKFAAVIEMFHLATLIHDDVIDDARIRRGKPALHVKYGKRISVLTGDYLFLKCYDLIAKYVNFPLVEKLSALGLKICGGEIEQAQDLFDKKISALRYLRRISGKTAALFSFSFQLGSIEAKAPKELQDIFNKIGYSFGISFQIIDDILDFTKKSDDIGKNVLKDISDGIYTLPVIFSLKKSPIELQKLLDKKTQNGKDIKEIIRIITENNGIKETMTLAEKYSNRALKFAAMLPESHNKIILTEVIKSLLKRDY